MRILIVTDAWSPQINGVVRTLRTTGAELEALGHTVGYMTHEGMPTFPIPTYPEIRLGLSWPSTIAKKIKAFGPDCIHIATEGTLGWIVRRYCRKWRLPFTTSFHSRFPEMIEERLPLPGLKRLAYAILRRFHAPANRTLAPTRSVTERLVSMGFQNVVTWTRGVDAGVFRPVISGRFKHLQRPVIVNAGRVAVEKNLAEFLNLDLPGTKVVVGDGPQLEALRQRYPDAVFTGYLFGDDLAGALTSADVFVFPSKTDTFGLVMLEALSCGTPVAALPVEGPIDVVTDPRVGALNVDLRKAIIHALDCKPEDCIKFAGRFTWTRAAQVLEQNLAPIKVAGT